MENILSHFALRLSGLGQWLLSPPPAGTAFDKPKDGTAKPAKPIEMIPPAFL